MRLTQSRNRRRILLLWTESERQGEPSAWLLPVVQTGRVVGAGCDTCSFSTSSNARVREGDCMVHMRAESR